MRRSFTSPRVIVCVPSGSTAVERRISYNEKAGRFEFQVVHNYGPGLTPTVSYASRPLCMGCHQNGGPIWSEPPWEETNSNPRIVSLLQEQNGSFHGVPVRVLDNAV